MKLIAVTLLFFKQFPSIQRALILHRYIVSIKSTLRDIVKLMANKWNKLIKELMAELFQQKSLKETFAVIKHLQSVKGRHCFH